MVGRSKVRAALGIIAIGGLFSWAGCSSSDLPKASFGVLQTELAEEASDSRITEQGIRWVFPLDISFCMGRAVTIRAYANDSVLLAQDTAQPPYDSTHWEAFQLFTPCSRLAEVPLLRTLNVYASLASEQSSFVGETTYTFGEPYAPATWVWSWQRWSDDVDVPGEGSCFQMQVRLDQQCEQSRAMRVITRLQDVSGTALKDRQGNPIVIEHMRLTGGGPRYWSDLTLNIPYEVLAHLDPTQPVVAVPAVRNDDGESIIGNLRIRFWAGGSLSRVRWRVEAEAQRLQQEIEQAEKRLTVLSQESDG